MCNFALTPQAAAQIQRAADHSNSGGMFLRVTARPGDAGAIVYGMGFDEMRKSDLLVETAGVTVVIAPEQAALLDEAILDYVELNTGDSRFIFVNPNDIGCFNNLGPCGHCNVACRPAAPDRPCDSQRTARMTALPVAA